MTSAVKLPTDNKEHEQAACQIVAVSSAVSECLHPLKAYSKKNELESTVARSAVLRISHRASHSTSPQNTSLAQCASDEPLATPTTASSNGDDRNKATMKRRRTMNSNLRQIPQGLSESKTQVSIKKPKSSEYVALELEELEEQTLLRYETQRHEDGVTNQPMSLLYNECSLVAISNWVAGSSPPLAVLLGDACYRRCLICKKWGHYESECLLGEGAAITKTDKRGEVWNNEKVTHSENLSDIESKYVLETCHGFVFEQRAVPSRPKGNNEPLPEGYLAVSTVEIDGSLITSVKALDR